MGHQERDAGKNQGASRNFAIISAAKKAVPMEIHSAESVVEMFNISDKEQGNIKKGPEETDAASGVDVRGTEGRGGGEQTGEGSADIVEVEDASHVVVSKTRSTAAKGGPHEAEAVLEGGKPESAKQGKGSSGKGKAGEKATGSETKGGRGEGGEGAGENGKDEKGKGEEANKQPAIPKNPVTSMEGTAAMASARTDAAAKVQGALASLAGGKGSEVTYSTSLTSKQWRTIFKLTWLYQVKAGHLLD